MDGPSVETIIRTGGWHPRYARVLLVEHEGERALALVDGNGDGAELELEYWFRDADGAWQGGSTSGHGALEHMASAQSWTTGDFVVDQNPLWRRHAYAAAAIAQASVEDLAWADAFAFGTPTRFGAPAAQLRQRSAAGSRRCASRI
jgi:hypothetical protein